MASSIFNEIIKIFKRNDEEDLSHSYQKETSRLIEYTVNYVSIRHALPDGRKALLYTGRHPLNDTVTIPAQAENWSVTHLALIEFVLPSPSLQQFPSTLTHLFIIQCGLTELPLNITSLFNLEVLDVTGNKLKEIPLAIQQLTKLKELIVMSNNLKYLPTYLINLPSLERIETVKNPISWPPLSVCVKGLQDIKDFIIQHLEKQSDRQDVLKGYKAYGSSLCYGQKEVPTLHSIVLNFLVMKQMIGEELPPRMRKQLAYVNDLGRPHIPILKCSLCNGYYSSEAAFATHICKFYHPLD
jgi:hypothetical protein